MSWTEKFLLFVFGVAIVILIIALIPPESQLTTAHQGAGPTKEGIELFLKTLGL